MEAPKKYMRTPEAAIYCCSTKSVLEKLRVFGGGPAFIRLGRTIVYATEDLDAWMEGRRQRSTSSLLSMRVSSSIIPHPRSKTAPRRLPSHTKSPGLPIMQSRSVHMITCIRTMQNIFRNGATLSSSRHQPPHSGSLAARGLLFF